MEAPLKNKIAAVWGVLGVVLILSQACWRLGLESLHAFESSWSPAHWITFVLIVIFMAYSEGYRAFQQQFSPRVVSRARTLLIRCTGAQFIFAPLFCMGFFHATRKRKIITYLVTLGIILLIIGVRLMPHPWRGMVDIGVVIGLSWGMIAIIAYTHIAWKNPNWDYPPDLPEKM
ncbi:MAG: hypothetical protein AAF649_07430 [Verrucomicrobiota bacterium]